MSFWQTFIISCLLDSRSLTESALPIVTTSPCREGAADLHLHSGLHTRILVRLHSWLLDSSTKSPYTETPCPSICSIDSVKPFGYHLQSQQSNTCMPVLCPAAHAAYVATVAHVATTAIFHADCRAFALEGRGVWHALSASVTQQVLGPIRARADFRYALDLPTGIPLVCTHLAVLFCMVLQIFRQCRNWLSIFKPTYHASFTSFHNSMRCPLTSK